PDRAQRLRHRAGQEDQADPGLSDDHGPQLRRGAAGDRLAAADGAAQGRDASQLAARRGGDHRRLRLRRGGAPAVSPGLDRAAALPAHRAAAALRVAMIGSALPRLGMLAAAALLTGIAAAHAMPVTVTSNPLWTDSGILLSSADHVRIHDAAGRWAYDGG